MEEVSKVKAYLVKIFDIKDLALIFGDRGCQSKHGIFISQKERKKKEQKVHHLLKDTGTLGTKPAAVSIEVNHSLYGLKIEPFSDLGFYIRG